MEMTLLEAAKWWRERMDKSDLKELINKVHTIGERWPSPAQAKALQMRVLQAKN